jgi:hypothetical protein
LAQKKEGRTSIMTKESTKEKFDRFRGLLSGKCEAIQSQDDTLNKLLDLGFETLCHGRD